MTVKLFIQVMAKMFSGVILVAILIFLPAGTLSFLNGWILMAALFVPMFFAGVIMMLKNPELLKRRLDAREEQKEQRFVIILSALMFIAGFIVAGLDFRFGWSSLHKSVSAVSVLIFLFAYLLYAEVIRENLFLSRTIKVHENQKVIDTGLYSIIRHPMYTSSILLFLSMPVILGSIWSFVIFLVYPFIIVKRIKYEEDLLLKQLDGYKEYIQKVKYRLIPFVW